MGKTKWNFGLLTSREEVSVRLEMRGSETSLEQLLKRLYQGVLRADIQLRGFSGRHLSQSLVQLVNLIVVDVNGSGTLNGTLASSGEGLRRMGQGQEFPTDLPVGHGLLVRPDHVWPHAVKEFLLFLLRLRVRNRLDDHGRLEFVGANHNRALDTRVVLHDLLNIDGVELLTVGEHDNVISPSMVDPVMWQLRVRPVEVFGGVLAQLREGEEATLHTRVLALADNNLFEDTGVICRAPFYTHLL